MSEFEAALLRLKERLGVASDKAAADALGLSDKALNARKRRGVFPADKLYALAAKRPELDLDVMYVLTGESSLPGGAREDLRMLSEAGLREPDGEGWYHQQFNKVMQGKAEHARRRRARHKALSERLATCGDEDFALIEAIAKRMFDGTSGG